MIFNLKPINQSNETKGCNINGISLYIIFLLVNGKNKKDKINEANKAI